MKKVGLKRMIEALSPGSLSLGSDAKHSESVNFSADLNSDQFQICHIARHGFPDRPVCMAHDPVQSLLATGSADGSIRIFGQSGVDVNLNHENSIPVIQLAFLINEGALLSVLADDTLHLWNLRQKKPAILHSLRFNRERVTVCNIPYQSKWIYIGTERGNVHFCNVETFQLSGYSINWNKAIDLSQRKHPGHIVAVTEHPLDENRILLAYSTGLLVLWKFKENVAEYRFNCKSAVTSVSWHSEGKQFMSSHVNGKICVWNAKQAEQPVQVLLPHEKSIPDSVSHQEVNNPIDKLKWVSNQHKNDFIIFSGGLHRKAQSIPTPCITIMQGKSVTALEMDFPIIDFVPIVNTPWKCEFQDPCAVAVLLEKEMLVVDLEMPGYRCIDVPHVLEIHDSPVTCLKYVEDKEVGLLQKLQYVSLLKSSASSSSGKNWPIQGGEWNDEGDSFCDIFVTGHEDGSVRFWNANSVLLTSLIKTKTHKLFEKVADSEKTHLVAIQCIDVCAELQLMAVSNEGSIMVFSFNEKPAEKEVLLYFINPSFHSAIYQPHDKEHNISPLVIGTLDEVTCEKVKPVDGNSADDMIPLPSQPVHTPLKLKSNTIQQAAGFQVDWLMMLLQPIDLYHKVVCLGLESSLGLLCIATNSPSLHIFDINKKLALLNIDTSNISRFFSKLSTPKSPSRLKSSSSSFYDEDGNMLKSQDSTESRSSASKLTKMLSSSSFENHLDHTGDGAFSNRSSSIVTEEQYEMHETVTTVKFSVLSPHKAQPSPCLLLGTDLGNVFLIELSKIPAESLEHAICKELVFQMSSAITFCEFLNSSGNPICVKSLTKLESILQNQNRPHSHRASQEFSEYKVQYVLASSKNKIKLFGLTAMSNHSCFTTRFHDVDPMFGEIAQCTVESVAHGLFFACLTSYGQVMVLSLPNLNLLFTSQPLVPPPVDCLKTTCFLPVASVVYMCSPSEPQRITFMNEVYGSLQENLCNLFTPRTAPERQQDGLLKTLFGNGYSELDRAELFAGKNSGTASRGVATKYVPQIKELDRTATGLASDMHHLRMKALERGQKLASVEEKTEEMHESAKKFSSNANALMLKMKNKKWYQL